jgi:hypothetical protein
MYKDEFIEKLNNIGWDKSQYIILSGGSMLMRGLKTQTHDFDLSVSKNLAEKIGLYNSPKNKDGVYIPFDMAEATDDMDKIEFDLVNGFQCQSLQSILRYKKNRGLSKDLRDIPIIEAVLA